MDNESETVSKRLNGIKNFILSKNRIWLVLLFVIIIIGTLIRVQNIPALGGTKLIGLDPYIFYRWADMIVETGHLPEIDTMRAYPVGFPIRNENTLLSYMIAYAYIPAHFLVPSVTLLATTIWLAPIMFFISMFFFFLFIRKLLDSRIALLATAFLAVNKAYIFRTLAGFTDKENPGMLFFFIGLYMFALAWDRAKNLKTRSIFGVLAGLAFGCMGWSWGAGSMIYFILGAAAIMKFLFDYDWKDYVVYSIIIVLTSAILMFTSNAYGGFPGGIKVLATSFTSMAGLAALAYGGVLLVAQRLKNRFGNLFPLVCLGATVVLGIGGVVVMDGFHIIPDMLKAAYETMITPFGFARHALTVAEYSHPYFANWTGEFGAWIMWLGILGAIFVFYDMVKHLSKYKWLLTSSFALFISALIFTRYSSTSIFDGVSGLSVTLYIGTALAFAALIIGGYFKIRNDQKLINEIKTLSFSHLFVVVWFIMMTIAARGAVRMFFIMTPTMALLAAYTIFFIFDKLDEWFYKAIPIMVASAIIILAAVSGMQITKNYADVTPQWEAAMDWVKTNTAEDAVFAHWWDYGYWVQGIADRPTILDGGQPQPAWNHYMGRHVLTGRSEQEALDFLYPHDAAYLLIDPTDIGKYKAYAFIGSDENYDRDTYINTFGLVGINGDTFIWQGGFPIDTDFEYEGIKYKSGASGIQLLTATISNYTNVTSQPVMTMNTGQTVPLKCMYLNGAEYNWREGYDGCMVIIPAYTDGQLAHPFGGAIFLSEKAEPSLMTKLYIRNYPSDYFKLVYTDNTPIAIYNGQLIGPIKIWQISYPANQTYIEQYIKPEFPEGTFYK